jgi:hypothetical protein
MRQPSEEEIRALEAEMEKLTVDDVLLQTVVTLLNLGARKAGLVEGSQADLPQVKLAIDGARATASSSGRSATRSRACRWPTSRRPEARRPRPIPSRSRRSPKGLVRPGARDGSGFRGSSTSLRFNRR